MTDFGIKNKPHRAEWYATVFGPLNVATSVANPSAYKAIGPAASWNSAALHSLDLAGNAKGRSYRDKINSNYNTLAAASGVEYPGNWHKKTLKWNQEKVLEMMSAAPDAPAGGGSTGGGVDDPLLDDFSTDESFLEDSGDPYATTYDPYAVTSTEPQGGMPGWAWALLGVTGVGAIFGGVMLLMKKKQA